MLGGKVLPKSMHVALCTHREMNSMQNSTARHTKWVLDKCCICIIDKKPSSLPLLYHILLGCLEFFLSSIVAEFASFLWDFIDYNKRKQKKADRSTKIVSLGFSSFWAQVVHGLIPGALFQSQNTSLWELNFLQDPKHHFLQVSGSRCKDVKVWFEVN